MGTVSGARKYRRIGDVAAELGVNLSALRHWEKEFPDMVRPFRRTGAQTRLYRASDVESLRLIKYLIRDLGYTTRGARARIAGMRKTRHE